MTASCTVERWSPGSSAGPCVTGASASLLRRSALPKEDAAARRGCAVRRSPSWPGSRWTISPGSSRAGPPHLRPRWWRHWPARCASPTPSATSSSGWPGTSPPDAIWCRRASRPACNACSTAWRIRPSPSLTPRGRSSSPTRRTTRSWVRPRAGGESNATASGATSSGRAAAPSPAPTRKPTCRLGLVADLRLTAARYPADARLKRLISELAAQSPRFVELWQPHELEPHHDQGRRKVIDHPDVGRITLDCDTLIVAADDLRIMIYTAEPETEDAERLALAIVLGTQSLIE